LYGTRSQYCLSAPPKIVVHEVGEFLVTSFTRSRATHLVPVLAVLVAAGLVVAPLAVDKEDGKVDDVEVGDGVGEASGKAPCPTGGELARLSQDRTADQLIPVTLKRTSPPLSTHAMSQSPK
jgi:hypothetical protein